MALILPTRRNLAPSGAVHVDFTHPLAQGLVFYALPSTIGMPEVIGRGGVGRLSGGTYGVREGGFAFGSNSTSNGGWRLLHDPSIFRTITTAFTVACHADIDAIGNLSHLVSVPYQGSWAAPYMTLGLGQYNTTGQMTLKMGHADNSVHSAKWAAGTFVVGKQQHIIATRNETAANLLIDRTFYAPTSNDLGSDAVIYTTAGNQVCLLNRTSASAGEGTQGAIHYAAIWNRALSNDEMLAMRENPYQVLLPSLNRTSLLVRGFVEAVEVFAAGAVTTPMQQATGEAEVANPALIEAAVSIPVQTAAGAAENIGLWEAAGAVTIPVQQATGAGIFVDASRSAAGAVTVPMQQATGTAILITENTASGTVTIPKAVLANTFETRYSRNRQLNGSNQYLDYTPPVSTQSNRNWFIGGIATCDVTITNSTAFYIVDFGRLAANTAGNNRVRLFYDGSTRDFVASSQFGTDYREMRLGPVTPAPGEPFFIALTVSSVGEVNIQYNKNTTARGRSGNVPAGVTSVCENLRFGAKSQTAPSGFMNGRLSNWSFMAVGAPSAGVLTQLAEGVYPGNVGGYTPTAIWAMAENGTSERNMVSPGTADLVATGLPPQGAQLPYSFGHGTSILPMQQATGEGVMIEGGAYIGAVTVPLQQISGEASAETAGVRGNFTVPLQALAGAATRTIPEFTAAGTATIPKQLASGTGALNAAGGSTYYVSTITNTGSTASLVGQEFRVGLPVKMGDVPSGFIVVAAINGAEVPTQISRRRFWPDGSLKYGEASILVPQLAPSATVNIEWRKFAGSWTAQDTGVISGPAAVVNNFNSEWRAVSWAPRPTTTTVGTDIGPMRFLVSEVLGGDNAAWIRTVYTGALVTEYEASIFGKMPDNSRHPNFAAKIYIRAWGGTASQPKRIQWTWRSMYGWDDNSIAATEQGYRVSWDVLVNNAVLRGSTIGTAGQTGVNGCKGASHFSFGTTGKMDWYDVQSGAVIDPPALFHKHKINYLQDGFFLPPIDLTNNADTSAGKMNAVYVPNTTGPVFPDMSDVGERDDITWGVTGWTARSMITHGDSYPLSVTMGHVQHCRTVGLAVAAFPVYGYTRAQRNIVSHQPTERVPDARLLPTLYNSFPEYSSASWSSQLVVEDSHFPQMAFYPYLLEGDHHLLQLVYAEATAGALHGSPAYGKATGVTLYDQPGEPTLRVGAMVIRGQMRAVAHSCRQIGQAVGIGHPEDLEHIYLTRQLEDWITATRQIPTEEDRWRGVTAHVNLKIYRSLNDPAYKIWMHTLITHSTAYVHGLVRNSDTLERAQWFAYFPVLVLGGYNSDPNLDLHSQGASYTNDEIRYAAPQGDGWPANSSLRVFETHQAWGGETTVTYNVNNTITLPTTAATHEGAAFVPVSSTNPAVLQRRIRYYAINLSGGVTAADGITRGGTIQISATRGGPAIDFGIAAPVSASVMYRSYPPGAKTPVAAASNLNSGQPVGFGLQMITAIKHYYRNCGNDPRAREALEYIEPYKQSGGWAEKAKASVTFIDANPIPAGLYEVFVGSDKVHDGADEVWSAVPTETYNGAVTIPLQTVSGAVEFAPGLGGDTRGAVTIPMQTMSGEAEAPELIFSISSDVGMPMIEVIGTLINIAPPSDFAGTSTIPMQQASGEIINASIASFGRVTIPMQTATGEATLTLPEYVLEGSAVIPAQILTGDIVVTGVPIHGDITIPMQQATGELASEQFEFLFEGSIVVPSPQAGGEFSFEANIADGAVSIPMQSAAGNFEFFITGGSADGDFVVPMMTWEGLIAVQELDLSAEGDFNMGMPVLSGEIETADFIEISGEVTIPMMRVVQTQGPRWSVVTRPVAEQWTVVTPA